MAAVVRWTSVVLVMPQPYRQSYILSSLIVRVGLLSLAPAGCLVAQPNRTMVRVLRGRQRARKVRRHHDVITAAPAPAPGAVELSSTGAGAFCPPGDGVT